MRMSSDTPAVEPATFGIPDIDRTHFNGDEPSRLQALAQAKALVDRLESPWEKMIRMVWTEPILLIALRAAADIDLFAKVDEQPHSSAQLAEATGSDAALLRRILRLLASMKVIRETGVDQFVATDFSSQLRAEDGLVRGIYHFYDTGIPQLEKLPDYLQKTGYRNPSDGFHPPWEDIMGSASYWQWLKERPEAHANFNHFLGSFRANAPSWTIFYPVSAMLEHPKTRSSDAPLLVDVGGGTGRDISNFARAVLPELPQARLIVQDLPEVIASAPADLHPSIERMPHNFFTPQPVKGARAYFMHSILHDWPNAQAREILLNLKSAMEPGYSRVLLNESMMPEKGAKPYMAALDINMMGHFAALERTEKQWRELLESAGLRFVKFWESKGSNQGVIEAELA